MKNKINIANLPTKIEKLEKISTELGVNIFLKEMIKREVKYLEIRLES